MQITLANPYVIGAETITIVNYDAAADWTASNPTLGIGAIGFENDTGRFKFGDGSTAWNSLAYATYTVAQIDAFIDATEAASISGALVAGYTAADTTLSGLLYAGYTAADTALEASISGAYAAADAAIAAAFAAADTALLTTISGSYVDNSEMTTISGDIVGQIPSLSGYATEAYVTTASGDIRTAVSAEIDGDIVTHTSDAGAHHAKYTNEEAMDAVAGALTQAGNVTITYDDPGNTITISGTGGFTGSIPTVSGVMTVTNGIVTAYA